MWFGWKESPAEDVPLDAAPDVIPGLQDRVAGFDGRDAPFDFGGPLGFGVGVRRAIETGEEFSGQFGASVLVEA